MLGSAAFDDADEILGTIHVKMDSGILDGNPRQRGARALQEGAGAFVSGQRPKRGQPGRAEQDRMASPPPVRGDDDVVRALEGAGQMADRRGVDRGHVAQQHEDAARREAPMPSRGSLTETRTSRSAAANRVAVAWIALRRAGSSPTATKTRRTGARKAVNKAPATKGAPFIGASSLAPPNRAPAPAASKMASSAVVSLSVMSSSAYS